MLRRRSCSSRVCLRSTVELYSSSSSSSLKLRRPNGDGQTNRYDHVDTPLMRCLRGQHRTFASGIWAALTNRTKIVEESTSCHSGTSKEKETEKKKEDDLAKHLSTDSYREASSSTSPLISTAVVDVVGSAPILKENGTVHQHSEGTATPPPAMTKMAFLAPGRRSARSPLFESKPHNPSQMDTSNSGSGMEGSGPTFTFAATRSTQSRFASGGQGFHTSYEMKNGAELASKSTTSSSTKRTIVVERNANGDFSSSAGQGLVSSDGATVMRVKDNGGSGSHVSPYREGVFDADGNPVLTREALIAQRIANSKKELKEAIEQIVPSTMGKSPRSSSVRYKVDVRQGQHRYTMELMKVIRAKKDPSLSLEEAIHTQCDFLNARERLDLLRMASKTGGAVKKHRRINKKSSTPTKRLPMYFSPEFKKKFYFREEDITEKSALGHGPGGQAANRRMQTIHIKHIPTGIAIRYSHFPSLYANRKAARIILSLKVEERELGAESQLGKMAAQRRERKERAARNRQKLEQHSASLERKAHHRHPFLGFLNGMFPLGAAVVPKCDVLGTNDKTSSSSSEEMIRGQKADPPISNTFDREARDGGEGSLSSSSSSSSRSLATVTPRTRHIAVTVSSLFDAHANRWWNILSESFYNHWCRPPTVRTFVRTSDNKMAMKRRVCGWPIGASHRVPGWFCYFFPIVCKAPPPLEKPPKELMRLAGSTRGAGDRSLGLSSSDQQTQWPGNSRARGNNKKTKRRGSQTAMPDVFNSAVPTHSTFVLKEKTHQTVITSPEVGETKSQTDTSPTKAAAATTDSLLKSEASVAAASPLSAEGTVAGGASSTDRNEFVDALLAREASQESELEEQTRRAKEVFFEYLRQKKKYDIVARTVQYHEDQLAQMKALPEGRKAVRNAINAVVEVFGLRVVCSDNNSMDNSSSPSPSSSSSCFTVKTDGPNWKQYRERLCTPDRRHVTPLGAAVFPHMIVSLSKLEMRAESKGLRDFFSERAASGKRQHQWAVEMLSLIEEAEADASLSAQGLVVSATNNKSSE